ncbi:MAG: stage III sporulation protein SpoIIIAB [Thermoactinomyces sp.]
MIKWVGAIFILIASTWTGFLLAGNLRERPRQIRELRSCLALLKTEINYGVRPLADALARIAQTVSGALSRILESGSKNLLSMDGESTYECLRRAIEDEWRLTSLTKTEKEILLKLCHVLGNSSREDQLHHLELAATQLEVEETKARAEQERYEKMYKTMGILAGALLVILLI